MDGGVVMSSKIRNGNNGIDFNKKQGVHVDNRAPKDGFLFNPKNIKSIFINASKRRNYPQVGEITSKASSQVKSFTSEVKLGDKPSVKATEQKKIVIKVSNTQKAMSKYVRAIYNVFHLYQKSNNSLVQFAAFLFGFTLATVMVVGTLGLPIIYLSYLKSHATSQTTSSDDRLQPFLDKLLDTFRVNMEPLSKEMIEVRKLVKGTEHENSINNEFRGGLTNAINKLKSAIANLQEDSVNVKTDANHIIELINDTKTEYVAIFNRIVRDIFLDLSQEAAGRYRNHKSGAENERSMDKLIEEQVKIINELGLPEKVELLNELNALKSDINDADIEFKRIADNDFEGKVNKHKAGQKRGDYEVFNERIIKQMLQDDDILQNIKEKIGEAQIKKAEKSGEWEQLMNDQISKYENHVQACEKEIDQVVVEVKGSIKFKDGAGNLDQIESAKNRLILIKSILTDQLKLLREALQKKIERNKSNDNILQESDYKDIAKDIRGFIDSDNKEILLKRSEYLQANLAVGHLNYDQHNIKMKSEVEDLSRLLSTHGTNVQSIGRRITSFKEKMARDSSNYSEEYEQLAGVEKLEIDAVEKFVRDIRIAQAEDISTLENLKKDAMVKIRAVMKQKLSDSIMEYRKLVKKLNIKILELKDSVKSQGGFNDEQVQLSALQKTMSKNIYSFEKNLKLLMDDQEILSMDDVNSFNVRTIEQSVIDTREYDAIEAAIFKKQLDMTLTKYILHVDETLPETESLINQIKEIKKAFPNHNNDLELGIEIVKNFQAHLISSSNRFQHEVDKLKNSKTIKTEDVKRFKVAIQNRITLDATRLGELKEDVTIMLRKIASAAVSNYKDPHVVDIETKLDVLKQRIDMLPEPEVYLERIQEFRLKLHSCHTRFDDESKNDIDKDEKLTLTKIEVFAAKIAKQKIDDSKDLEAIKDIINNGIEIFFQGEFKIFPDYDKHVQGLKEDILRESLEIKDEIYLDKEKEGFQRLDKTLDETRKAFATQFDGFHEETKTEEFKNFNRKIAEQISSNITEYRRILESISTTRKQYYAGLMAEKLKEYSDYVKELARGNDALASKYKDLVKAEKREPGDHSEQIVLGEVENILSIEHEELMTKLFLNLEVWTKNCDEWSLIKNLNANKANEFIGILERLKTAEGASNKRWRSRLDTQWEKYQYAKLSNGEIKRYKLHVDKLNSIINLAFGRDQNNSIVETKERFISYLNSHYLDLVRLREHNLEAGIFEELINPKQVFKDHVESLMSQDNIELVKLLQSAVTNKYNDFKLHEEVISSEFNQIKIEITREFAEFELISLTASEERFKANADEITKQHDLLSNKADISLNDIEKYVALVDRSLEATDEELNSIKEAISRKWGNIARNLVEDYKKHLDDEIVETLKIAQQSSKAEEFTTEIIKLREAIKVAGLLTTESIAVKSKVINTGLLQSIEKQKINDRQELEFIMSRLMIVKQKTEKKEAAMKEASDFVMSYFNDISDQLLELRTAVQGLSTELATEKEKLIKKIDKFDTEANENIIKFQKAADEVTDDDKNKFLDKVSKQKQSDAKKVDELRKAYHELKVKEIELKIIKAVSSYEKHANEFPPRISVLSKKYTRQFKVEALLKKLKDLNESVVIHHEVYGKDAKVIIKHLKLEDQEGASIFIAKINAQIEKDNKDILGLEKELNAQVLRNLKDQADSLVKRYSQHTVDIANSLQNLKEEFGEITELSEIKIMFSDLTKTMLAKRDEFNSDLNSIKDRENLTEVDISTFEKQILNQVEQDKGKLAELDKAIRAIVKNENLKKFDKTAEKYRNHMDIVRLAIEEIRTDIDQEETHGFNSAKEELSRLEHSLRTNLQELKEEIVLISRKPSITEQDIKGFDELVDSKMNFDKNKISDVRQSVQKELEHVAEEEIKQYKTHLDPKISGLEERIKTSLKPEQYAKIMSELETLKTSIHEPTAISEKAATLKKVNELSGFRIVIVSQKKTDEAILEKINIAFLEILAQVNNAKLHAELQEIINQYSDHVGDLESKIERHQADIRDLGKEFSETVEALENFSQYLRIQHKEYKGKATELSKKGNDLDAKDVEVFKKEIDQEELAENKELERILSLIPEKMQHKIESTLKQYISFAKETSLFLDQQSTIIHRFSKESVARHYVLRLQESLTANSEKFTSRARDFYQGKGAIKPQQVVEFVEDVNAALNEGKGLITGVQEQIKTELKDWASGQVNEYKKHLNTEITFLHSKITNTAAPEKEKQSLLSRLANLEAEIKQAELLTSLSEKIVDEDTAVIFEVGINSQKEIDHKELKSIDNDFLKLLEQDQSKKQLNELLAKYNQHIVESLETLEHISDVADKPSVRTIMELIFIKSRDLQQALVAQRGEVVKSPVFNQEEIEKNDIESFTVLTTNYILANNKKIEALTKEMIETFKEAASTAVGQYKLHLDTKINKARTEIGEDTDLAAENPTKGEILKAINELEKNIHEAKILSGEADKVSDNVSFEALSKKIDVQKGEDRKKLSELINKFEVEQEAARLGNMGTGYEKSIEEFNADVDASKKASKMVTEYKQEVEAKIEKIKKDAAEDPNKESRGKLLLEIEKAHQEINERLGELEKYSKKVKEDGSKAFEQRLNEEKGKTNKELSELEKTIGEKIQNSLKEQVKKSSDEYKEHATGLLREIDAALKSVSDDEEEFGEKFEGDSSQLINLKKQVEAHLDKAEKDCEEIVEESPIDKSRLNKFIADLKDKKSSEKDQMKKIESEINTRRQEYFKKKINSLLEEYQSDSVEVFEQIINLQKSLEEKFPESDHLIEEGSTLRGALPFEILAFKVRNSEVEKESTISLGIAYGKGKLSLFRGLVAKNKKHNHDALDRLSKSYNGLRAKKSMEQYNEHALNCSRVIGSLELNLSYAENREEYLPRLQSLAAKIEGKKSEFTKKSEGLINTAKSDEKEVTEFEGDVTQQIKADRDELNSLQLPIKEVLKNTLRTRQEATIKSNQEQAQLRGDYKNLLSHYEEHNVALTKRITQILEKVKPDGIINKELTSLEMLRERLGTRIDTFKEGLANLEKAEKVTKEQVGEFKNVVNSQQEHDLREFGGAIAEIQKIKIKTAELVDGDYALHLEKINSETQKITAQAPKLLNKAHELRNRVLLNKQRYQDFVRDGLDRNDIQSNEQLFDMINETVEFVNNAQRNIEEENKILRALIAESEQVDESSVIDGDESDVELPEEEEELLPENFDIQNNKKVLFDLISDLEKSCENAGVSPHHIKDLKIIFSKVFSTQNKNNEKLFYMSAARFTEYTNELFSVVKKDLANYKNDEDWIWSKESIFRVCDNYYYHTANSRLDTNRGIAQQDINQLVKTVLDRCIFAEDTSAVVNYTESDFNALFGLNLHENLINRKIMQTSVQTLYRTLGKKEGSEISWQDIKKVLEEFDQPSNISHTERMRQIYGALIVASTIFGRHQDIDKILDIWQSCWGVFQDPKFIVPSTTLDKAALRIVNKKFNTLRDHNKESKVPLAFPKFGQFLDDFKRLSNLELAQNSQVNDIQDRFLAIIPGSYKKKYKLQKGNLITHLITLKSDDRKELFTSVNIEQNRSKLLALCSDCEKYNILHPMFKLFLPGGIDQQPKKSDSIKPNKAKEISLETINDFDGERNFSFLKDKFDEFYSVKIERLNSMMGFQNSVISKLVQKKSSIDDKYNIKDGKKTAVSVKNKNTILAEEEKRKLDERIEKCKNRNIELEKQINTIKEMKMSGLNMIM